MSITKIEKTYFGGVRQFKQDTHQNIFQQLKKEKLNKHQSFKQLLKQQKELQKV